MATNNPINDVLASWASSEGVLHTDEILRWIQARNEMVAVSIHQIPLDASSNWKYLPSEGVIANSNRTFFVVAGFHRHGVDQPILLQREIGYLGILAKRISGVVHFLMQAKIEPGNINKVQLSPTIQATKSNFTQKHGGSRPPFLEYFLEAHRYRILVDQVQSEQAARFLGKRNRNIVLLLPDTAEVPTLDNYRWMTLGQIKRLMRHNNLVNMDTRTVLSCLPYYRADESVCATYVHDAALCRSLFSWDDDCLIPEIFRVINDSRMFEEDEGKIIPLENLHGWHWQDGEFVRDGGYHFKVIFCDISIEGREVRHWTQPLLAATGMATFGLICATFEGVLKFLVRVRGEIGNFDGPELGPTVQLEADERAQDAVENFFFDNLSRQEILFDGVLSEEGGRFYHEQNRNILMRTEAREVPELPAGYFWLEFGTLNRLVQHNNVLNIQLRNLLSLLEI